VIVLDQTFVTDPVHIGADEVLAKDNEAFPQEEILSE